MVSLNLGKSAGKLTKKQVSSNRKKAVVGTLLTGGVVAGGYYALSNMGDSSSGNSNSSAQGGTGGSGGDDGSDSSSGSGGVDHSSSNKIRNLFDETTENEGYILHLGEILDTYYYANLEEVNFEGDYKEISESGTIKLGDVDKKRFYKGIRLNLRTQWKEPGVELKWENLIEVLLGFITEQTFHEEDTEIKISGMSKTLEQKYKFKFTDMKRSEIIREVILTAGLVPAIDVEGLEDDVTSFTNVSSSNSSGSSSGLAGGEGETIDSLVKSIVGSETNDLEKAKLIHGWLQKNVVYSSYSCSNYDTPEKCLKNKTHLNCADTARLTRAMMSSAGLKAYVVGRRSNGGHFWTVIEINGTKYASDQTGRESSSMAGSEWNTVWAASGRSKVSNGGGYERKCGKEPDC